MKNISDFNRHVLRAMASLYKAHPKGIDLSADQMLGSTLSRDDPDFQSKLETVGGTAKWLGRNGLVQGKLEDAGWTAFFFDAQLSSLAYRTLREVDSNAGRPLGDAIVSAVETENERDISVLADLIIRRLS